MSVVWLPIQLFGVVISWTGAAIMVAGYVLVIVGLLAGTRGEEVPRINVERIPSRWARR